MASSPDRGDASRPSGDSLTVVCLSPQSWHVDLPTNRQQIMARVRRRGHDVLFVETGPFAGRNVWRLIRGPERRSLLRQLFADENVEGVRVMKAPNVLPWGHSSRAPARWNARLAARLVRRRLGKLQGPVVLWLYDPCFVDAIGRVGEAIAVYDCVDDYAEQARGDARKHSFVASCDVLAASRARLVFTTVTSLLERHRAHNPHTHLVRNVGDYEHFRGAADRALAAPEVSGLARPVVGFAGNLMASKVDFELLAGVARRRPDWTVLLVGPVRDDARDALDRLRALPNVRWLNGRPYRDVPAYVAAFDVAVIPYVANAYTHSCFPLKTFEYLAAGKPVVAAGLPELADLSPHVRLVSDAEEFVEAIEAALARRSAKDVEERQELAARNTWETRTERLLELIDAALAEERMRLPAPRAATTLSR